MHKLYVGMKLTRPRKHFHSYYIITAITTEEVYVTKHNKSNNIYIGKYGWSKDYVLKEMIPYNNHIVSKRSICV